MELDRIYNVDCLEGMKMIPDESIDAIICDLPYGTTDCKWDSTIPLDQLWSNYERILKKNGTAVLFAVQPFTTTLGASRIDLLRHSLVWLKDRGANFIAARYQPYKCAEDILVFSKGNFVVNARNKATYNPQMVKYDQPKSRKEPHLMSENYSLNLIRNRPVNKKTKIFSYEKDPYLRFPKNYFYYPVPMAKERLHPTQKPVELIRYLIRTYSNEGDTILDNCMGSGTTAIACIKEKRHYIGFELNKEYYDKSLQRIKNETQQLTLF